MITSEQPRTDGQAAPGAAVTKIVVGLEEICVSRDPAVVLSCLGLGSCIGISAYDPVSRVAGMAHIVLPDDGGKAKDGPPGKYATTGVPQLIQDMQQAGALKSRIAIKIAGGARIFANVKEGSLMDIGFRNLAAVKQALDDNNLRLQGENTGGSHGRSLLLYVASGLTRVTSAMHEPVDL